MKSTQRPARVRPPMQQMLNQFLSGEEFAVNVLAQLFISKLEAQGAAGISKYFDWFASEIRKRYLNEDGLTWEHPFDTESIDIPGNFSIELTPEDIEHSVETTSRATTEAVQESIETIFKLTLEDVRNQAGDAIKRRAEEIEVFRRRLASRWSKPLHLFAVQLGLSIQFGSDMTNWLRSQESKNDSALTEALLRLHARACQIAGEVEVLLQAGFADGALSRWRTLHEVATVAIFLHEKGNASAQRYLDHLVVDSYDLARKIRAASDDPDDEISDREMTMLTREVDELKAKYGKDFGEEYGWAADALKIQKPNFSQIEKAVCLEHLRPYYKLASSTVHAGPKGVFWKLGLINNSPDVMLAGPSNSGLVEAGRLTARSLANISMTLMLQHTVVDSTVWAKVIYALSKEIENSFIHAQQRLEDDEARAQAANFVVLGQRGGKMPNGHHEKLSARLHRRQGKL